MNPLRIAIGLVGKSNHKVFKHVAVVIRGGAIVSVATNHDTTHAEIAALNKCWPSERKGTKMWSIRVTRGGKLSMAKPCANCERYMRESGVKTVFYTTTSGTIEKMKL